MNVSATTDPINKLIENIAAFQKKRDELEMDVKLLDTVLMTYDIDFAKIQHKEEKNKQEKLEIMKEIHRIETENLDLIQKAKDQRASKSKMLMTLESMTAKQKELETCIQDEETAHKARVEELKIKFAKVNSTLVALGE